MEFFLSCRANWWIEIEKVGWRGKEASKQRTNNISFVNFIIKHISKFYFALDLNDLIKWSHWEIESASESKSGLRLCLFQEAIPRLNCFEGWSEFKVVLACKHESREKRSILNICYAEVSISGGREERQLHRQYIMYKILRNFPAESFLRWKKHLRRLDDRQKGDIFM